VHRAPDGYSETVPGPEYKDLSPGPAPHHGGTDPIQGEANATSTVDGETAAPGSGSGSGSGTGSGSGQQQQRKRRGGKKFWNRNKNPRERAGNQLLRPQGSDEAGGSN